MRLFHLHFFTAALARLERALQEEHGFTRAGVFGVERPLPLDVDLGGTEGPRLRLVEMRRGSVNLVLMPGKDATPRLEHLGWSVSAAEHARILEAAERAGWSVVVKPARTFLSPALGFRLELRIDEAAKGFDAAALRRVRLRHAEPRAAAEALGAVLGLPVIAGEGAWTLRDEGCALSFENGAPLFAEALITHHAGDSLLSFAPA